MFVSVTGCRISPPPLLKTICSRGSAGFAANLREESGELVIVTHLPAVERMVVALGTLNPRSQKYLGNIFRELERVPFILVEVRGGIDKRAAL